MLNKALREYMIAPWYVMAYTKLERIAWRHGYCLALHGSMARDLDIVAVPWTDDASSPETLIKAFNRFIAEKAKVKLYPCEPVSKPHGRLAWALPIGHEGHYLDVSVMPKVVFNKAVKRRRKK